MEKFKKRLFLVSLTLMVFALVSVSAIQAVSNGQTVQAYQGVKIIYNGKELTGTTQPYIINNSTYVPLRMLMDNFGDKFVYWDSVGYRVLVTDKSTVSTTSLQEQLAQKDAEITTLKDQISSLQAQVDDDTDNNGNATVSDIRSTLVDYFEDAGDNYLNDSNIVVSIALAGDEDDLTYTIKLDFSDSDEYSDIRDVDQSDLEDFLDAVETKIEDEIEGTDFEDAVISGKLYDRDDTSYYVSYEDGGYDYSWQDSEDEITLSQIRSTLLTYFSDGGDDYLNDDGIVTTISLSGGEDDITYTIRFDFTNADDLDALNDASKADIENFLDDFQTRIENRIKDTNFEGANITGRLYDNDDTSIYVKDNGSSYSYYGW